MAAEFDEPVFDEAFVRSATFTEPSARERARPPGRRERWRARRAARRARRGGGLLRRRRHREPSHRRAVFQVLGGVLVLFAISVALWWWNSAPRDAEPVRPARPTVTNSPAPAPPPTAPATDAPPIEIPEI